MSSKGLSKAEMMMIVNVEITIVFDTEFDIACGRNEKKTKRT